MVSLREKLGRLNMPRRHAGASGPAAAAVLGGAEASAEVRLERLRRALGRALGAGRGSAVAGAPAPATGLELGAEVCGARLPFERCDTDWGTMDMLRLELPPCTRHGRMQLGDGVRVDMQQLALLGHTSELADLPPSGALYLDTESTGFGTGTGNYAFLVGACFYDAAHQRFVLEQVLLRDPDDEEAMLRWLQARVAEARWLVSYNGKSFDLPLLRGRSVMCRMPSLAARPQLDLLHAGRRVHRYRRGRRTLGVLEQRVLDHHRGHDVSGAEVAERYLAYLHHRQEGVLADVVRHNQHDVLSLVALVGLYGGPLEALEAQDLLGVTRTLWKRRALGRARVAADLCLRGGAARSEALRLSAFVHKANGDLERAQEDFERLAELADPEARLELAKLYEHVSRDPRKAFDIASLGTTEAPADAAHRLARLVRKQAQANRRLGACSAPTQTPRKARRGVRRGAEPDCPSHPRRG